LRRVIKLILPPIIYNMIKKLKPYRYGWSGDYANWRDAIDHADGYESDEILKRVKESLLKVKNGEAIYERDSVIFDEIQYSWQLLSGLMFASAMMREPISVVDFGGSLGSTYYQNRAFLDHFDQISWSIVEQKNFVDVGREEFEDGRLKFFYTIEECWDSEKPNILLFSSLLQYINRPYELLDSILRYNFEYILIDRTPFSLDKRDKIKLQTVPPSIYKGSYPCWFFDEDKFLKYFEKKGYTLIESFKANDGVIDGAVFRGMIWRRDDSKIEKDL